MSRREHAWIHVVFGNVNGSVRFLETWFLGALGGNRKEDTALKGQIQEMEPQGSVGARLAAPSSPWVLLGPGAKSNTSPTPGQ